MPTHALITVVKRALHTDLLGPSLTEKTLSSIRPCPTFEDGQTFTIDRLPPARPDGFCDQAWADIQRELYLVAFGGTHPNTDPPGICFPCCTDGLRPVTFRIERVEE
ncbi:TIGR04076 family protein [Candidatus Bipolaricaulota bacterium]